MSAEIQVSADTDWTDTNSSTSSVTTATTTTTTTTTTASHHSRPDSQRRLPRIRQPRQDHSRGTTQAKPPRYSDPIEEYFYQQTKLFKHLERRFEKFQKKHKEEENRAKAGKYHSSGQKPQKSSKGEPKESKKEIKAKPAALAAERPLKSEPSGSSGLQPTTRAPVITRATAHPPSVAPLPPPDMSAPIRRAASALPAVASTSRALSTSVPRQARIASGSSSKKRATTNPDAMALSEAIRVLRALEIANPSSAYSLTITTRHSKSSLPLRGRVSLPLDARKAPETILVFAEPDSPSATAAREAGAHFVGGEELIVPVLNGELQPTKVLATPGLMGAITRQLARFLGPKGLMPSAKRGGVGEGEELGKRVKEAGGLMEWKADKLGVVRAPVARMPFTIPNVDDNVRAFITAVKDTAAAQSAAESSASTSPRARKPSGIITARLETTHGPSIELNDVL